MQLVSATDKIFKADAPTGNMDKKDAAQLETTKKHKSPKSVSVRNFTIELIEVKELDSDLDSDSPSNSFVSPMYSPLSPLQSETPLASSSAKFTNKMNRAANKMEALTLDDEDSEDLDKYMLQKMSKNVHVRFDQLHCTRSNLRRLLVSSKGLSSGCHSWSVQISKTDIEVQEMGVISAADLRGVAIDDRGVHKTKAFGARAVFGSELSTSSLFRGSYNGNGKKRCSKDLSEVYKIGWCCGDIIRIRLNLEKATIKFWWNGKHVKNVMRVQKDTTYYPFISFAGNCRYILL